jgi:hypothetical protein
VKGGNGSYIIQGGSGSETITLGDGNNTITTGNGNDAITVENGKNTISVGYGTNNFNLGTGQNTILINGVITSRNVTETITGFGLGSNGASDIIDFIGISGLTTSAAFNTNGSKDPSEVDVYSGTTQVATLYIKDANGDSATADAIYPTYDGNNGTAIEVDQNSLAGNIPAQDPIQITDIMWSVIHIHESTGGQTVLTPYVPFDPNSTTNKSGLTISQGVDLGKYGNLLSADPTFNLSKVFSNYSFNPNLSFLAKFIGQDNSFAVANIGPVFSSKNLTSTAVSITTAEANALTNYTESVIYNGLAAAYNGAAASGAGWNTLSSAQKTAIYDIAYNFGLHRPADNGLDNHGLLDNGYGSLSYLRTFWSDVVAYQWNAAASVLAFQSKYIGGFRLFGGKAASNGDVYLLNPTFALPTGRVANNYISGATVFVDANGNGVFDVGEPTTTTDATGGFVLPTSGGPLIAEGGTFALSGVQFYGQFSAPAGFSMITPLTTLVFDLASAGVSAAEQNVLGAFGLPSTLDLATLDPVAAADSGDLSGAAAEVAASKAYTTVSLIAATLAGAGASPRRCISAWAGSIPATIPRSSHSRISLATPRPPQLWQTALPQLICRSWWTARSRPPWWSPTSPATPSRPSPATPLRSTRIWASRRR